MNHSPNIGTVVLRKYLCCNLEDVAKAVFLYYSINILNATVSLNGKSLLNIGKRSIIYTIFIDVERDFYGITE